nr:RusA family crossover junction endodeoxyribonuclease [[Ruminococcus] torques]
MRYKWFEKNRRRDLDNVSSFGRKVIQDALVRAHILQNDGWKEIVGFSDEFFVDAHNPRIEVEIEEVT